MGKLIEKITKNRVVIITAAMIAVVVSFIMCNKMIRKENNVATITDPETLRAMSYERVTEEDANVEGVDNIKFSAYFLRDLDGDGYAEKYKGTCTRIKTEDREELNKRLLYIDFNVLGDGKFKNGVITINNKNFTWKTTIAADNIVEENYNGDVNIINLNDELLGGSQKLFSGSILPDIRDNINNYSKTSTVTLTGIYVDDDGNETPISKTINITIDWYGTTKTVVNKDDVIQTNNINTLIRDDKVKVKFDAIVTETEEELILQKQIAVIHLPELNGYKPTNAYTTHRRSTQSFNSETGELTISNNTNSTRTGDVVVNIARNNKYSIVAEYPLEAYTSVQDGTISMDILIVGYNYGFNNQNSEFSNPHISQNSNIVTVIYDDLSNEQSGSSGGTILPPSTEKKVWSLDMSVGSYIYSSETGGRSRVSKDTIIEKYNGNIYESLEDTYVVTWNLYVGRPSLVSKIVLEEQEENEYKKSDKFLSSNNNYYSMRDYESTIGLEFKNASLILGGNGYINVYNAENDTLIDTFNRQNWNNYCLLNVENLKSIRIETSTPISDGILSVKQTKKIDDDKVVQDFTKEDFQKMRYIYSYVKGTIEAKPGKVFPSGGTSATQYTKNYAYYEEALSRQSLSIEPGQILNQATENVKIKINTESQNNFEKLWQDGVFLIEMPEDIIYAHINNVTSSSVNVGIRDYSLYKENGQYYIKIYTDGNRDMYTLIIDVDITANPLKATKTELIKLYAYNPICNNYYNNTQDIYDLDGDSSTQDAVGYATTTITTAAPSGLLTSEYITNYDDNNNVTIAPNVAEVEKSSGARTATINVGIANNYSGTISEVSILGRIPYEGNKYILIDRDMKSEFNAYLTGPIDVPQSQVNNVTIYYSENGFASKDLNDANNGWVTAENISDWKSIKSYLIDFGDYVYTQASNDTFSYEVEIPSTVNYDEATFSNHAVFYTLETENGKVPIQTEPNRVGIQAVGIYNLKVSKNKLSNINTKVQGAEYKVSSKDANGNVISKILTTDVNGEILFEDMYIGREYIIEEISCPEDYELKREKIKFCASVDEQDSFVVNIINDEENNITGNFAETPTIEPDANGKYTVNARLEDESKYTIILNKTNESNEPLSNVLFQFGEDRAKKTYSTDANGRIVLRGLEVGREYKIQEVKADGYYIDDSEKTFKVYRDEENGESVLKVYSDDEKYNNATIEYIDGVAQTQVTLDLENEKIPTYTLKILKEGENGENNIPLQGAYFRLASADTGNNIEYETDENGKIEIDGLYLRIYGKRISGEYVLQETRAPEGYINSAEEIVFSVEGTYNEQTQDYDLSVNIEDSDNLETLTNVNIEDNTLILTIKNEPLFKLTKLDSDTGEILSNVEFIIYKINDDGTSDYAKDEYGNYIGTLNDNGDYTVTTDEYGVITLPLPDGLYCAVEVTYPNGYQEKEECDYFKVGSNEADDNVEIQDRIIEINYIEDLVELSNGVSENNGYKNVTIKLMRNLDFEDASSYRSNIVNDEYIKDSQGPGFKPIGDWDGLSSFKGTFDGQGYEIKNIYITSYQDTRRYEYIGLFGYTDGAHILNLGISGEINCLKEHHFYSFDDDKAEYLYVGGIVGYASKSNIEECHNNVSISGRFDMADDTRADISTGTNYYLYAKCWVGGIAGFSNKSTIKDSYNKESITAMAKCTRYASRQHRRCVAYCKAGGIVGEANGDLVTNTYNKGSVSATAIATDTQYEYAAGIIGDKGANCTLSNSYNVGTISNGAGVALGIISNNTSNCYTLTGMGSISGNIENRTEEQMKSQEFVQELASEYWEYDEENINDGYPILSSRTSTLITEINYIEDLVDLANNVNNAEDYSELHVKLMRDLDFADAGSYRSGIVNDNFIESNNGTGFSPIGKSESLSFKGTFDGQGYEIKNLYVYSKYAGLFGKIENAEIKNLSVSGNIYGRSEDDYVGGIAAKAIDSKVINCQNKCKNVNNDYGDTGGVIGYANNCEISECSNSGNISTGDYYGGYKNIGGIVGYAESSHINNCHNSGELTGKTNWQGRMAVGGIVGQSTSTINNCYNNGNINGVITGGIVGHNDTGGQVSNCYNTGSVNSSTTSIDDQGNREAGGIAGRNSYIIKSCYNIGNITSSYVENKMVGEISDALAGGIAGYSSYEIVDCYNMGDVSATSSNRYDSYAGGIVGKNSTSDSYISENDIRKGIISNCYNTGNLFSYANGNYCFGYVGGIATVSSGEVNNTYYLDSINIDGEIKSNVGRECDSDYMKSKNLHRALNTNNVWLYRSNNYPILLNKNIISEINEVTEFYVYNTIKKFKITTDINEIDNYKGGSISGEDEDSYEIVDYEKSNTKKIEIIPEDGFCIKSIKINDQAIPYTVEEDGSYTIEANYFTNMTENKHVVVEFVPTNNLIYIKKTDKNGNPLEGAEFIVERINDTPVLGPLTNNGSYYFVEKNGKYVSNNKGKKNTTANSYMLLDLTNYQGKYQITVNAQVSSQKNYDCGYVTISNTITAPAYGILQGRMMSISGDIASKDYSTEIEGGNVYYIHLGYYKNSSIDTGNDCLTVNSVTVKPVELTYTTTTNSSGIAMASVDYLGKYKISEIKAPEHYTLNNEEKIIELTSGESSQTVEYEDTRKTEIVVHHYLEGTTNKVAVDDIIEGSVGEHYDVIPHYDLDKLKLVDNQISYSGTFEEEGREYIIYYEPEQVKLTIHHYYDETENKLVEDKYIYTDAIVEFIGEAQYKVSAVGNYELKENEDYKTLINDNEFVAVITDIKANTTIDDILEYNTDSEISYYYKLKDVGYKVQYYYNGALDEEKTEVHRELCGITIDTYTDKCLTGYKFDYVKALDENGEETEMPLTLRRDEEYNIINVYYITDESQTKKITYKVEYYKDGVKAETKVNTSTVQVLQNTVPVNKEEINTIDKYYGYKFEKVDPEVIPDNVTDGTVIKVYYVLDENATKELSYQVEYYRNNVKVDEDTQTETVVVHVLEPNTLTVKKDEINTVDKYENCACIKINPNPIPNTINSGSVIKVYYIDVQGYKFEKKWINKTEEERGKYRTTYTLYKNINGTESTVKNENYTIKAIVNDDVSTNRAVAYTSATTAVTVTVTGNGTVEFKGLPRYNNGNPITYVVKETNIEKTANNGSSWSTQNSSNYRTNYNDEYEVVNRLVENTELFKITTEIAPNTSNERVGGTITGEFTSGYPAENGKRYVETVGEGELPLNDIVVNPDEGYIITSITINGNGYKYIPDADGKVIIPKEYFQNIKENKHIIVSFVDTNKLIKIIKEDDEGNRIAGAEFSISNKKDASSYIGEITADPDYEYYFEENSDGVFESNNYGTDDSVARSYSEIDLSNLTESFKLSIDVTISSEWGYDTGYIEIEDLETGSIRNIGNKSGSQENIILETNLQGGKKYKVYYCYSKDSSSQSYDDRFYINNVKLEEGNEYTAVTNENGEAFVEVSSSSEYNIVETVCPVGYIKSDETKVVSAPNEVTFVNRAIKYTITTEIGVNSIGERAGGTITGEYTDEYPVGRYKKLSEKVLEAHDALNDIVISPDNGYKVESIKINNLDYTYTPDENGNVVIPKSEFTNVTKNQHVVVIFGEEEKTITIVKTDKRTGAPLPGAKFRFTSNFERNKNLDYLISDMYKGNNNYYFVYNKSNGTYTNNNQNQDDTVAYGYKIVDLSEIEETHTLSINAQISSESGCDYGYVVLAELNSSAATGTGTSTSTGASTSTSIGTGISTSTGSTTTAVTTDTISEYSYNDMVDPVEMFKITGDKESQAYTAELSGGKQYIVYFVYGKDSDGNEGTDTFTINSIHLDNSVEQIVAETTLTDENGIATVKITGYGEYTVQEIVTPDGYTTMDNITYELLVSDNNPVLNIQNEREGVSYSTYTVNYFEKGKTTPLVTSKTSDEIEAGSTIMTEDEIIEITGYEYDSADVDSIVISDNSAENVINIYYTRRNDLSYTVNYLEKGTDNVLHTPKTEPNQTFKSEILSANEEITIPGYRYDSADPETLTIGAVSENNVINLYYTKRDDITYTVHYYYDGIEDESKLETLTATYKSIITSYEDKANGYVLERAEPLDTNGDVHLEITSNPDDNRINVFYRTQYKVTTEVVSHTEAYKDGTTRTVKGGTISGDGETAYEYVFKGDDTTKTIVIRPNEGYEIVSVRINDIDIDFSGLLIRAGYINLNADNGFFTNMDSDKHVEVEFRKNSNVIVKYLEKDTNEVLATQDDLYGNEGEAFETARKSVSYYKAVNITDENGNAISTYSRVTSDDELSANGTMYADTLTIIYWYEKIPSGIIVKHIAINEVDKQDLDFEDGTLLDEDTIQSYAGQSETTNRNSYTNYIAVDGPASSGNVIVASAAEDSKTVTCGESVVKEVRYYYERQYKLITGSGDNGIISGEDEAVYEYINDRGYNSNEIVITPDSGYRVKDITINGTIYPLSEFNEDATSHVITLGAGSTNAFFKDVQEDKNVYVEFEKIPAKVVVKYLDTATGEEVVGTPEKLVEGYVGDSYNEPAINIPGYILADDTTEHPLPTNASGPMTEADIEVVYWYTKQFTITTSAGEGGSSIIEGNVDKEVVTRGNNNTLKITMTPDDGYEIDKILINDVELDYENDSNIVIGDGYVEIPANYFTNVQENIYVVVEFARIPARVKVEYLDGETNESLFVDEDGNEYETIEGYVNKEYTTTPKDIPYYEVIEERLPRNANGRMSKDEITVTYYYRKSKFNMKVEKEILNVVVNNETVESNNKKNVETIVKYNDISSVSIKAVYKIKVTNTEEVAGTAVLDEQIPEGFEIDLTESEGNWQLVDGKYTLTTDEILPGESKEYIIILKWIVSDTNQGTKTNIALITDTTNGANYEETTTDDNESSAIISITLEKVEEEIDEPEVDIRDKEIEPELIVPDSINEEPVISKKIKSIKTGDELYYYIAIVIIAEVMIVIAIRKKNK